MAESETLADVLLELTEAMAPIVDAVIGHRNALIAAGFDDESATEMASVYHDALVDCLFGFDPQED